MKTTLKSPLYSLQQRQNKIGNCAKCKKENLLFVDHIFPSSLLQMWGLKEEIWTDAENLQLLCRACGILKSNRFDFSNPKTIPLIEKYIKRIKELST